MIAEFLFLLAACTVMGGIIGFVCALVSRKPQYEYPPLEFQANDINKTVIKLDNYKKVYNLLCYTEDCMTYVVKLYGAFSGVVLRYEERQEAFDDYKELLKLLEHRMVK